MTDELWRWKLSRCREIDDARWENKDIWDRIRAIENSGVILSDYQRSLIQELKHSLMHSSIEIERIYSSVLLKKSLP